MSTPTPKLKLEIGHKASRWVEDVEPPKRDPYAVPEAYRAAYDAATPDPYAFLETASWELVQEQNPGSSMLSGKLRDDLMKDDLPEVMRRAEHISRLTQARDAVEGPKLAAAAEARRIAEQTCPVCHEVTPSVRGRVNPFAVVEGRMVESVWRACQACEETARSLWSDAQRTKEREKAVKAALSL